MTTPGDDSYRPRTIDELARRTDELLGAPVCKRCHRVAVGWPLDRGDRCSPRGWANCLRDPWVVLMENAVASDDTEPALHRVKRLPGKP